MKILGIMIKEQRLKHGISQYDLAFLLGVSQATMSRYEHGWNAPSLEKLMQLSSVFCVSTDYLLGN